MNEELVIPPHSIQAEQSVLGGLMLDNEAWDKVADRISDEDFYRHDHRLIFRVIFDLANKNKPMDVVTVSQSLKNAEELEEAGGMAYLGELAKNTPSAANISAYADIVRDKAIRRGLISAGRQVNELAGSPDDTAAILDQAEAAVLAVAEQSVRGSSGLEAVSNILKGFVETMEQRMESGKVSGLPTCWSDLDEKTSGLHPGDLVIVAGRPSMGKTAFAMNLAEHAVIKQRVPVAVFSLEMEKVQLVDRLVSGLARIDFHKLRTADLEDEEWNRVTEATKKLNEAPLFIDDTPAMTPLELRSRARRLKREHGLGLVVVDYLQLMQSPGRKENRTQEVSEISRSLKALAKELRVPVIALSQLNRSLEQRPNKRPLMSDLRESGAIEQDADMIMFIYRDEVYNEESHLRSIAEIIIGKQRNGPTGTVYLTFLGELLRFENHIGEIPKAEPPKRRAFSSGFDYSTCEEA